MLGVTYYHQTIRKYVAVFGTLFNDLNIERTNASGTVIEKVKIPLAYGPKQKWLLAMADTTASRKVTATRTPRMGFALTSVDYDPVRKLNTVGKNWAANSSLSTTTTLLSQFNPVPYNFAFDLFILVKNAEDGTQILEQILPYFTPEFTVTVNTIPDMGIKADIPVVLNSSSVADEYEGDLATRRTITWTLSFTLKGYIYPDIKSSSIIKTIEVNFRIPATAVTTSDLSNYILMESGSASATKLGKVMGIRTSHYKYLRSRKDLTKNVVLYNLKNDPNETKNIASLNPQIVEEMEGILQKITTDSAVYDLPSITKDESKKVEAELRKLGYLK